MKPFDLPITHNGLRTKEDLLLSLEQLLAPLAGRYVNGGAGLHLGNTGAVYEDRTALMEGWSRVLWGLVPALAGGWEPGARGGTYPGLTEIYARELEGLRRGTDPDDPAYWGMSLSIDQRQVEMAAIAYALILCPRSFWDPLSEAQKSRLAVWLGSINGAVLPGNNWEFFRILVNLALKIRGQFYDADRLAKGLDFADSLYVGDGWYRDPVNFDLYNPFAFHFYGLVYARLMGTEDPVRCSRYRERARLFARQYVHWFARDGACVPFGRSLTYRFAVTCFFAAAAFADEEVLPWGVLKGIVLRNMRWWFRQAVFDHEGILSVGYAYPNLIMAEQYNSPTSPYWALKTYVAAALPDDHPFWKEPEVPLPGDPGGDPEVHHLGVPHMHLCRIPADDHAILLSAGQYPVSDGVNMAAKYAKFAYSSRYGMSVSHGAFGLEKTGCDSSLLLSEGDGYWRERRHSSDHRSTQDYLFSRWLPWPDVEVSTWIVPCLPWHVRIHRIVSPRRLVTAEGGFSLPSQQGFDAPPVPRTHSAEAAGPGGGIPGAGAAALIELPWGVSRILGLAGHLRGEVHRPEPNLNVLFSRSLIPVLHAVLEPGTNLLACAVYAGSRDLALPSLGLESDTGPSARIVLTLNGREMRLA